MSNIGTLWNFYRVDTEQPLLEKVEKCLAEFKKKYGMTADVVGVPSSLPKEDETFLQEKGVEVVRNIPAWAKSEIWVGIHEEEILRFAQDDTLRAAQGGMEAK